jgi:hypothetical protein
LPNIGGNVKTRQASLFLLKENEKHGIIFKEEKMKKKIGECTKEELQKVIDNPHNGTKSYMAYAVMTFGKKDTSKKILDLEVEI